MNNALRSYSLKKSKQYSFSKNILASRVAGLLFGSALHALFLSKAYIGAEVREIRQEKLTKIILLFLIGC
ncbi:MAG: hypothetical protein JJ978_12250 [Roseivirga sp.]|jgi:L-cystine uptake protein TcyP (sodium:dicarboxylate symporter family)|uniref:hypothetical protein n=1 Tax=Roseivirga sp. TaxID=1964215 RepID=UPI001B108ED0|nr:hypothetical protein [Roseivirga sp.]MBO6496334.1 hypothetical protein [Roseivirga sp.]